MVPVELASTSLFNDANLVSYYKLEDINDSKGSNTLTNNNTVAFNSGLFNNAADFSSGNTNKSLTRASGSDYFVGDVDKSFSMWVNMTTQPSNAAVSPFSWGNATNRQIAIYNDSSGTKTLGWNDGTTGANYSYTLTTGAWFNIVYTYLASSKTWKTYVNAVLIGTDTGGNTAANLFSIGNDQQETSRFLSGLVDDFSIFSRVLNQADINIINGIAIPKGSRAYFM